MTAVALHPQTRRVTPAALATAVLLVVVAANLVVIEAL